MSLRLATFNVENLMNRFDFSGYPQPASPGPDAGAVRDRQRGGIPAAGAGAHDRARRRHAPADRARHRGDPRRHHLPAGGRQHRGAEGLRIRLSVQDGGPGLPPEIHDVRQRFARHRRRGDAAGRDRARPADRVRAHDQPRACHLSRISACTRRNWPALGNEPHERIFRRDCLEIDVTVGGRPLTIYSLHFKSMGSPRNGLDGREATMPIRIAEAQAVRRIIEERFGKDHAARQALGDLRRPQRLPAARHDRRRCPCRLRLRGRSTRRSPASTCCSPAAFAKTSSSGGRSSTAGRSTTRAGRRSGICASSTTSCCRRRWPGTTPRPFPTSSAAASRGGRSFRRARRWNAIRAPAGTGRRRPTIARWR